jgi:hypothetical protein
MDADHPDFEAVRAANGLPPLPIVGSKPPREIANAMIDVAWEARLYGFFLGAVVGAMAMLGAAVSAGCH